MCFILFNKPSFFASIKIASFSSPSPIIVYVNSNFSFDNILISLSIPFSCERRPTVIKRFTLSWFLCLFNGDELLLMGLFIIIVFAFGMW